MKTLSKTTKTRRYFTGKLNSFRNELIKETKRLLVSKCKNGSLWYNDDDANCIKFCNNKTGCYSSVEIDSIYISKLGISIYPKSDKFSSEHLSDIMNVHSLFLIHSIASQIKN